MATNIYSTREIIISMRAEGKGDVNALNVLLEDKLRNTVQLDPKVFGLHVHVIHHGYTPEDELAKLERIEPRPAVEAIRALLKQKISSRLAITHEGLMEIAPNGQIELNGKTYSIDWAELKRLATTPNTLLDEPLGNFVDPNRTACYTV